MNEVTYIDAGRIISLLNRTVLNSETTLRSLEHTEGAIVTRQIDTVLETAHQFELSEDKWKRLVNEVRALVSKDLQDTKAIALNWGLVTLWSTFEALLEDLLLLWFKADNRAFLSWGGKMSVTFEEIKDIATIDLLKLQYFEKAIKNFTAESIEKRIDMLRRQLNVRDEILFSQKLANDTIRAQLGQWGPASLTEIADKRNRIVHRLALPLKNVEELQVSEIMLERFLLNVTSIIAGKLNMPALAYGVYIPTLT